ALRQVHLALLGVVLAGRMQRRRSPLLMVVLAAVVGCTSGSDGGVDSRASASGDAGANADTAVVNAVAPYDYDSAIDEAVVQHVLADGLDATVAECVTGKGGVSSYEPVPPPDRDSITDEALADFPNLAL